jgi:TolB-like protein/DNA-binding winged helix-turn-helix (wHTH) protein
MEPIPAIYWFGPFRLDLSRRTLEKSGTPVTLSSRAFDLLQTLIEAHDRIVGRDELVAHAWPGMTVEASNLTVQMSALRRALGDVGDEPALIATVPGRGYRFIGRLENHASPEVTPVAPQALPPAAPLPADQTAAPARPATGAGARPAAKWRNAMAAAACAVPLALGGAWFALIPGRHVPSPPLSIVVMPFRNLSADQGRAYLADAISDDLTTDLSHIPGSLVIARASADAYKGRSVPAGEVGRALNVRYLLEGSLHAEGDVMRVNAQLIDTATGAHLWAERFDVTTTRMMDMLNDVVRRIASALDVALVNAEAARAEHERPNNPGALDLFFRARSLLDRANTLNDMTQAQHLFERAIQLEPDFVDALAALGWLLVLKDQGFEYPTQMQDDAEAGRVTSHAMALAPHNPAVLAARGRFLVSVGNCAEASAAAEAALAIDPDNEAALVDSALCAWRQGEPEKVGPALEATLRVDPQGPAVRRRQQTLGMAALFSGHADQAIRYLLQSDTGQATPVAPMDNPTWDETNRLYLIAAYALSGDLAEARRRYQAYQAIWPHRSVWRHAAMFTPAQTGVPQFPHIEDALVQAGMPRYADPRQDFGVAPTSVPLDGGEFAATPLTVPGAETIDTARLRQLLAKSPPPLVVDAGKGMAVISGAILLADVAADAAPALNDQAVAARLRQAAGGIVVMDTGCTGVDGYNTALTLLAKHYGTIYWYRGGEEAWAAAGLPAEDRRGR